MASSRRGSSRKRSPLVGHTWHASSPVPVNTTLPASNELTSPLKYRAADPLSDGLWSGEWKLLAGSNSSDWPSQSAASASSTSWSDELETESTRKLSDQFELLESALYGDANEQLLANSNLASECRQWKERFPHLRAVGTGVQSASPSPVVSCQTDSISPESENVEEVIAAHGNVDQSSDSDGLGLHNSNNKLIPVKDLKEFRERVKKAVLDQIFSTVWPDVVKRIEPVIKKLLERNKVNLVQPPAVMISTQGDSSTYSSSDVGFESSADQFLQVSPVPLPLSVREDSGRKSRMSTISHITANLLDYSNDHRHRSGCSAMIQRGAPPTVNLVFPTAAEKLLTPIRPDVRNNSLQVAKRTSAKLSSASNRSRYNMYQQKHPGDDQLNVGRFCNGTETGTNVKNDRKKSPLGNWTRHGVLPPISLKDNSMKVSSAFSKRSSSALQQNGVNDLDARPNTSLPTKNGVALQPLDKFDVSKDNLAARMEMAQQWIQNQILPTNYGKSHLPVHDNMNGGWRSRMSGIHRK